MRQVKRRAFYFEGKNGEEPVERDVPEELMAQVGRRADAAQMPR